MADTMKAVLLRIENIFNGDTVKGWNKAIKQVYADIKKRAGLGVRKIVTTTTFTPNGDVIDIETKIKVKLPDQYETVVFHTQVKVNEAQGELYFNSVEAPVIDSPKGDEVNGKRREKAKAKPSKAVKAK